MTPIRLVVVDDHALFRLGLVSLLGEMEDFIVVGEAGDGREALEVIRKTQPDVVLIDINMPVLDGIETVAALRKVDQNTRVIMLTISRQNDDLFGAIQAGAEGYLLKNVEPEELRAAIKRVYAGQSVLAPEVTRQVMHVVVGMQANPPDAGLSKREMEVLD